MANELILPNDPKIVADSTNWTGVRLTSMVFPIPTCLLAELRTHRLLNYSEDSEFTVSNNISEFSVNANSDRAIPIKTKIKMVNDNPYIPIVSLANTGMTANEEVPEGSEQYFNSMWKKGLEFNLSLCSKLLDAGASKQYVNRLLMAFSWSEIIVTGDDKAWNHFFNLRTKQDVEPNFRTIARKLKELYDNSQPVFKEIGEYHISFENDLKQYENIDLMDSLMVSGSCCARISYNIERLETLDKHRNRFVLCVESNHASITEHQAKVPTQDEVTKMKAFGELRSNVDGWILLRKLIESKKLKIKDGKLVEKGKWDRE